MKKIVLLILIMIPFNIYAISASSYIVMDQNSNRVLAGSNIDEDYLIASITKIMTAIIVIEEVDNLDNTIEVTEEVLKAYGSAIYIEVGEQISIRDLLYGLMLRSGNDAAIVLAQEVSGSMEKFATLMNDKVSELGLKNTTFVNNHGLEEETGANKSSTYDMAVITSYAMKNETFAKISGTEKRVVETNYKTYSWTNKNRLLFEEDYITGGKTGYTEKAGRTLVTTASKDNMDLVVVTINDGNDWNDHISLYESIFNNYQSVKVIDKEITSVENKDDILIPKNDYYALVTDEEIDSLKVEYLIYEESVGKIYGEVIVYLGEELLYKDYLYLLNEEKEQSIFQKILEWLKIW